MPRLAWEASLASLIILLSLFVASPAAAQSSETCIENACIEQTSESRGAGSCEEAPASHDETWGLGVSYDDGADRASTGVVWRCQQSHFFGSDNGEDLLALSASTGGDTVPTASLSLEWRANQFGEFESCGINLIVNTPDPVGSHFYRGDCPADVGPADVLPSPAELP